MANIADTVSWGYIDKVIDEFRKERTEQSTGTLLHIHKITSKTAKKIVLHFSVLKE